MITKLADSFIDWHEDLYWNSIPHLTTLKHDLAVICLASIYDLPAAWEAASYDIATGHQTDRLEAMASWLRSWYA